MKTKKSRWSQPKLGDTNTSNYFYDIPNSKLLTILIIVTIALVIIFFCLFKYVTKNWDAINNVSNSTVSTFLSIIGVPIGIILSFIIATAWASFADAQVKQNEEALSLLLLYDTVQGMSLQGAPEILEQIKVYTANIINSEFAMMSMGMSSQDGLVLLLAIGESITTLEPVTSKDVSLYNQALAGYQKLIADRVTRYNYVLYGVAPELWWVLVLGVVLIIFLSFFMYCSSLVLHCLVTCIAAAGLISLLFLAIALNFPYRGDFGLDSDAYQLVLANMTDGECDDDDTAKPYKHLCARRKRPQIPKKKRRTKIKKNTSKL